MSSGFSDTERVFDSLYGDVKIEAEELVPSSGGSACDKPGRYHVLVNGVKMEALDHEGIPSVARLDLLILDGTDPTQKERTIYHRVRLFKVIKDETSKEPIDRAPYSAKYITQAVRAAFALGLTDTPTLRGVDWEAATGRQCVVKVDASEDEYNGKVTLRHEVGFGNFWRIDHEDVKEVPKDGEALALLTGGAGIGTGGDDFSDI